MNSYLNERKKKKRRRTLKIKIFCGLAVFLALAIGGGYLVVYSSLFQIENISILMTSDVPNIDVNLRIKDFFNNQSKIAGFLGSGNILAWKEGNVGGILKDYPELAEIKIEKDYFNREVKIEVRKRERFGIWCLKAQTNADITQTNAEFCGWFDESGVIFREAPQVEGNLIRKVDDFSGRSLKIGDSVLGEKFLFNLIGIFRVLEQSDLTIKSLKLENLEFQEVITESSPEIHFSLRIDPQFALTALEAMKGVGLDKIEYIDLTVENRVYYKLLTK